MYPNMDKMTPVIVSVFMALLIFIVVRMLWYWQPDAELIKYVVVGVVGTALSVVSVLFGIRSQKR